MIGLGGVRDAAARARLDSVESGGANFVDVRQPVFGSNAFNGVADNTAQLVAAIAAISAAGGGYVRLPPLLAISANVTVPVKVAFQGGGGTINTPTASSRILCTTAAAGITITEAGGTMRDFVVDGNLVADCCIKMNGGGARLFASVHAIRAGLDNWILDRCQNNTFIKCEAQFAGRDSLQLIHGTGGHLFLGCEFNGAGRHNVYVEETAGGLPGVYTTPTHIKFVHCLMERIGAAVAHNNPTIRVVAASEIHFDSCVLTPAGGATALAVDVSGAGVTRWRDTIGFGTAGQPFMAVGTGATVDWDGGSVTTASAAFDLAGTAVVQLGRAPTLGTGVLIATSASNRANINAQYRGVAVNTAKATADPIERGSIEGETGERFRRFADGSVGLGDGTGYTFETGYSREFYGGLNLIPKTGQPIICQGGLQLKSFTTAARPFVGADRPGVTIWDSTLGKPIVWSGTVWKDFAGVTV